jgi:hypothetical protein
MGNDVQLMGNLMGNSCRGSRQPLEAPAVREPDDAEDRRSKVTMRVAPTYW